MKKHLLKLLFGLTLISLTFSCDEEEDEVAPDMSMESELAADVYLATAEMDEIFRSVDEAFTIDFNGRITNSFCATVNLDRENKILTMDYGDGCTGRATGVERKGKISVAYTGTVSEPESGTLSITFEDYEVNGTAITGIASSTAVTEENGGYTFKRATDMTITFSNGEQIVYDAEIDYAWTEGAGDRESYNEVFLVSGTATGTSRDGSNYSLNISTAYRVQTSCFSDGYYYPVSGVSEITVPDSPTFTIDFGIGNCDKMATLTMGRFSQEIELP